MVSRKTLKRLLCKGRNVQGQLGAQSVTVQWMMLSSKSTSAACLRTSETKLSQMKVMDKNSNCLEIRKSKSRRTISRQTYCSSKSKSGVAPRRFKSSSKIVIWFKKEKKLSLALIITQKTTLSSTEYRILVIFEEGTFRVSSWKVVRLINSWSVVARMSYRCTVLLFSDCILLFNNKT